MEQRRHRDLMITVALLIVIPVAVLGWRIFSQSREGPPMVVSEAVPGLSVPAAKPDPAPQAAAAAPTADAAHPEPQRATVRVHVVGAVKHAAVYTLPADARVDDAVKKAGGATADADLERINLADHLQDAEQVRIPRKGERALAVAPSAGAAEASSNSARSSRGSRRAVAAEAGPPAASYKSLGRYPSAARAPAARAPSHSASGHPASAKKDDSSPVNLNTAGEAELRTLKGVGPVTAAAILDYRQQHGPFQRIEDLMEVRGIGPKKFEKMKDRLVVR